ncbi:MAG: M23 family metallopeptidase [Pseudomonadota bacterium]
MHIILVSNHMATARTLLLTPRLVLAFILAGLVCLFSLSLALSWLSIHFNLPFAERLVLAVHQRQADESKAFLRDNLNTMATKLGEMQAQLLQLGSLGERVANLTGIALPEPSQIAEPLSSNGQGGPLVLPTAIEASHLAGTQILSSADLQRKTDYLSNMLEQQSDSLTALESQLMERRVAANLLPTLQPLATETAIGSGFGWRIDPLLNAPALHEGVDFVTEEGTPVRSAAGGMVIFAEAHPTYGYLVEIDHGNGFTSRYAHLSAIEVQFGQLLKRGQEIGLSGNTGRSTGPHLHFEVRYKGNAQNPLRFLQKNRQLANAAPGARSNASSETGALLNKAVRTEEKKEQKI